MSSTPESYSRTQHTAANRRQARLDETATRIDTDLTVALIRFVEANVSNGAVVKRSWHVWNCRWQQDTGDIAVFLGCEGPHDDCFLLVSYVPHLKTSYEGNVLGLVNQVTLANLCTHLQTRTGLPTRLG